MGQISTDDGPARLGFTSSPKAQILPETGRSCLDYPIGFDDPCTRLVPEIVGRGDLSVTMYNQEFAELVHGYV